MVKRRKISRSASLLTAGDQLSTRFIRKKSLKLLKFSTFRTLGMPVPAAAVPGETIESGRVGVSFRCATFPPSPPPDRYCVNKFRFSRLNHCSRKLFSNLAPVGFGLGFAQHQHRKGHTGAMISAEYFPTSCAAWRWENLYLLCIKHSST